MVPAGPTGSGSKPMRPRPCSAASGEPGSGQTPSSDPGPGLAVGDQRGPATGANAGEKSCVFRIRFRPEAIGGRCGRWKFGRPTHGCVTRPNFTLAFSSAATTSRGEAAPCTSLTAASAAGYDRGTGSGRSRLAFPVSGTEPLRNQRHLDRVGGALPEQAGQVGQVHSQAFHFALYRQLPLQGLPARRHQDLGRLHRGSHREAKQPGQDTGAGHGDHHDMTI